MVNWVKKGFENNFKKFRIGFAAFQLCSISCSANDILCKVNCYYAFYYTVYISWFLLPFGAVGNPIITVVTQKTYRSHMSNLFWKCYQKITRKPLDKAREEELSLRGACSLSTSGVSTRFKRVTTSMPNSPRNIPQSTTEQSNLQCFDLM